MRLRADRVKVRVPGTTASFGPATDALALALATYDEASIRGVAGASQVRIVDNTPGGRPEYWLSPSEVEAHATVRAMRAVLDVVGAPQIGIHLTYRQGVPRHAGLGAHEAEVLIGAFGAWTILGKPGRLDEAMLLNVAGNLGVDLIRAKASLDGGLSVRVGASIDGQAGLETLRLRPMPYVQPMAFIPEVIMPAEGVELAPAGVSLRRHGANIRRATSLIPLLSMSLPSLGAPASDDEAAMEQWRAWVVNATVDDVLEDHREVFAPASLALIRWLRERGHAAFLSGLGPAVVCLWNPGPTVEASALAAGWKVLELGVDAEGLVLDV